MVIDLAETSRPKLTKSILKIIFGNVLIGFAYAQWMRPNGIINGGVTSIAMILERLTPVSIIYLANGITLLLLLLCLIFLGKETFLKSVFSGICYNLFFALFTLMPFSFNIYIAVDFLLACLIISYGYYCCISAKASTVGMDVIALVLNKRNPKINIAKTIRYINLIVLGAGFLVYGLWSIIFGVLFSFINTYLLQIFLKRKKQGA